MKELVRNKLKWSRSVSNDYRCGFPAGGDFSEPVTENTKRFVNAFLALDKKLAYARHYPAIHWLNSYSGYIKMLTGWYKENVSEDIMELEQRCSKY